MNLTRRFLKLSLWFTVLSSRETGSSNLGMENEAGYSFSWDGPSLKTFGNELFQVVWNYFMDRRDPKSEARFSQEYAQNDHICWAKTGWLLKWVSTSSFTECFKSAWIKAATQTTARRRLPSPYPPPVYLPLPVSFLGPL